MFINLIYKRRIRFQMSTKEIEEQSTDEEVQERYFDYYIKKNTMWITIFLSLYLLLDIIAIFISTNYTFLYLFLYFGILMMVFGAGVLFFVWREKNYFWAIITALFIGLTPLIEIIIHLATVSMSTASLVMAILSLVIALALTLLPLFLVYWRYYKELKIEEQESN